MARLLQAELFQTLTVPFPERRLSGGTSTGFSLTTFAETNESARHNLYATRRLYMQAFTASFKRSGQNLVAAFLPRLQGKSPCAMVLCGFCGLRCACHLSHSATPAPIRRSRHRLHRCCYTRCCHHRNQPGYGCASNRGRRENR